MNNEQFNERVNGLWAHTKAGNLPRHSRFEAIEALTEEYFAANGRMPEVGALDRLATLCLYEEMTDKTPYKIANTEYPTMNSRMYDERRAKDVSIAAIEYEKEHKQSNGRRKRSPQEHAFIDRRARDRNVIRRKRYRDFIQGKSEGVLRVVIKETE